MQIDRYLKIKYVLNSFQQHQQNLIYKINPMQSTDRDRYWPFIAPLSVLNLKRSKPFPPLFSKNIEKKRNSLFSRWVKWVENFKFTSEHVGLLLKFLFIWHISADVYKFYLIIIFTWPLKIILDCIFLPVWCVHLIKQSSYINGLTSSSAKTTIYYRHMQNPFVRISASMATFN